MYISVWDMNKFKNGLEDDDEQCCYLPRYGTDITGLRIYCYITTGGFRIQGGLPDPIGPVCWKITALLYA